jgi:hypothetical protein
VECGVYVVPITKLSHVQLHLASISRQLWWIWEEMVAPRVRNVALAMVIVTVTLIVLAF